MQGLNALTPWARAQARRGFYHFSLCSDLFVRHQRVRSRAQEAEMETVKILSGPRQRGLYSLGVGGMLGGGRQECKLGSPELPGSPVWS